MLVFLSLSLISWRLASRFGFSSFDAEVEHIVRAKVRVKQVKQIYIKRYDGKLTCTFPWFTVFRPVPWGTSGTTATVTSWFVIRLFSQHPMVRWHFGKESFLLITADITSYTISQSEAV